MASSNPNFAKFQLYDKLCLLDELSLHVVVLYYAKPLRKPGGHSVDLNDGWTDPAGNEVVKARFTDLKLRSLYPGRVKVTFFSLATSAMETEAVTAGYYYSPGTPRFRY